MRLAILSDIHDNSVNLNKALDWINHNSIDKIIFGGDATTLETMQNLARFAGEIFIVSGNVELYEPAELSALPNLRHMGERGLIDLDGLSIGLTHEPRKIPKLFETAAKPLDFIFYGHTHKPWLETRGTTLVANPGNLAGQWYPATFAVLDTATRKLELKRLANLD